ncbi:AAA family ATPase [Parachlamydia acanthamoebae]|jgi:predicted kinase|uniref:AAA family ATPase n=1 Tax=Parachlamydia acanthamoebae TaxID=83552 RepID=UPI0001C1780C|nr:AAA family ATPase [Parachlamydia acanthamoebae]EFB42780.1 hypothetical protein pah_c002o015 [Parachlamydia acanthamoebae str. Hall's coccus]
MHALASTNSFLSKIIRDSYPNLKEFTQHLGSLFPLINQLCNTLQDKEWHAEGDVFQHTQLVLTSTYDIIKTEASHLTNDQKLTLILAAVLHDIGKPLTTKEKVIHDINRIVAPNHEALGCSYIAYRMLELDLPYHIIQQVINLVNYHHKPKLFVIKNVIKQDYFQLARQTNVELLYYIAKADMLGRQCAEQQHQVDLIHLFRINLEDHGIWKNNPYEEWRMFFENELKNYSPDCRDFIYGNAIRDFEANLISTPHEAIARHYAYLNSFPQLVIMVGPSGSGKSRWIQEHLKDHIIISLDELRKEFGKNRSDQSQNSQVMVKARQELKYHLARHKKIVWDATTLRKDFRSMLINLGMDYHALVTLVVFHQKTSEIFSGNKQRKESIPQEVLNDQMNNLEWVDLSEAHRVLFVNRRGVLAYAGGCASRLSPY